MAMYESFTPGCGFASLSATAPPTLANGLHVDITNAQGPAVLVTGWSNTRAGTMWLPLSLSPYVNSPCFLHVSPDVTQLLVGPPLGVSYQFPNSPGLLGLTFYQQAMVPGGFTEMTNATVAVIGP